MRFTRDVLRRAAGLAQDLAPEECVALLSGRPGGPCSRLDALDNVADQPRYRYEVQVAELVEVRQHLEDIGFRPMAALHSHVDHAPQMSPTDVAMASDPSLAHLIVSLALAEPTFGLWRVERPGDALSLVRLPIHVTGKDLETPA